MTQADPRREARERLSNGGLIAELQQAAGAIALRVDASCEQRTEIAAGTLQGRAARALSEAEGELDRMREALLKIKRLKPESIGDSGFQTGPLALFEAAKRIARAALSPTRRDGE